ncbi:head decoration protein [Mesobacillus thioparans]|uniref:head decoration protein n=1 Tax=Mesobacillus thioparans TaxID=370439 RepID=UPI0039EFF249
MENQYKILGEFTPDNLIAGQEVPVLVNGVTLASGQGVVKRGAVVGIVTASGLAQLVDKTKADGTQNPFGILTDDVDTENGTVTTTAYVSGLFNPLALTFGGTDSVSDHKAKLRELGIYLKENKKY